MSYAYENVGIMARENTPLEAAQSRLRSAKKYRNDYYSFNLGHVENNDGILRVYNQKGRNSANQNVRNAQREVYRLSPHTPPGTPKKSHAQNLPMAVAYEAEPASMAEPARMAVPARMAEPARMAVAYEAEPARMAAAVPMGNAPKNNNNMSNPLNRINSLLFKRAKFSKGGRRKTRKNRKNRRSTRKN